MSASTSERPVLETPPRVAVVILNWRRPDDTLRCAFSVAAADYGPLDIVICDNASPDDSYDSIARGLDDGLEALNARRRATGLAPFSIERADATPPSMRPAGEGPRISLVQTGRNGGYAYGNNVGLRLAMADPAVAYLWVLNNDTEIAPDSVSALVRRIGADRAIGICGPKILYLGDTARVQCLGGGRFLPLRARCELLGVGQSAAAPVDGAAIERALSYVSGAAAFVRREFIETVGLMDEGYFLYWEEIDWAERGAGRYRLGYCDEAIVYHSVGASIGTSDSGPSSLLSDYYLTRSRLRFLRRFHPLTLLVAVPLTVRDMLREARAGRMDRARNLFRAAFGRDDARAAPVRRRLPSPP